MSSDIWTRDALRSSPVSYAGECWRFVEAQHKVSTAKLTDNAADQALLERLIEDAKPKLPPACAHLDFLLAAPFRYAPYPHGSRFRRVHQRQGAFYASERVETAAAESAFYRLLFFIESPATPWPSDAAELTAFSVEVSIRQLLDLRRPPFSAHRPIWTDPTEYAPCQALADAARTEAIQAIRYESIRDPQAGSNLALLAPEAFASPEPRQRQTWRLILSASGVRCICEFPARTLDFGRSAFAADPRIGGFGWKRS